MDQLHGTFYNHRPSNCIYLGTFFSLTLSQDDTNTWCELLISGHCTLAYTPTAHQGWPAPTVAFTPSVTRETIFPNWLFSFFLNILFCFPFMILHTPNFFPIFQLLLLTPFSFSFFLQHLKVRIPSLFILGASVLQLCLGDLIHLHTVSRDWWGSGHATTTYDTLAHWIF